MSLKHVRSRRRRRRIASKGGHARAAKRRAKAQPVPPYAGSFLTFLDAVGRGGSTRAAWRTFWKVADGLPLDPSEVETFTHHTGRTTTPTSPAREVWCIAGRRAGKSENVTARATWRAISANWHERLAPGERGVLPIVAPDRDQARNTLSFLKGLSHHPLVAPHVVRRLRDSVEFGTGVTVRVATANFRAVRGFTFVDVLLEETAFYRSDESANPDAELLAAVRPAMLTIPGARIYGISTPYARRGILFDAWQKYWGQDADALVWVASSEAMHPNLDAAEIARAFEDDPAVAGAEYGRDGLVSFRSDVEAFVPREAVEAVVEPGMLELAPLAEVKYAAFVDPAGGTGTDSYVVAIAHTEEGVAVLDCVREIRPRFSPDAATTELAKVCESYGIKKVVGDRFGGDWPGERWREHGIQYEASAKTKSDIYREALPIINARRCELLDLPRLKAQLVGLERRVARSGKDSIDHGPGQHDDVANAVCGALVLAAGGKVGKKYKIWFSGIDDPIPDWKIHGL